MSVVVGRPAATISAMVRAGERSAVEVVRGHLDHLAEVEHRLGAFVAVRRQAAVDDAAAVDARDDRHSLTLAGVPIVVPDAVAVAGEPVRHGSVVTSAEPAGRDHPVVARLREAGAVVVGRTRCPELQAWGTSDDPTGIAVSPWDPTRSAGGGSGGSAAAVAAGVVPVAIGIDGMGGVRIPASCCGAVGIRPGAPHVVDDVEGEPRWFGMARFGVIATTVEDAAVTLDVLAGTSTFRDVVSPEGELSVAVSWRSPSPGVVVNSAWREAAIEAGRLLRHAGHSVVHADPPYERSTVQSVIARWTQGVSRDATLLGLDAQDLQPRTRAHVAAGDRFSKVTPVRDEDAQRWRDRVRPFLEEHDVLVTPAFARTQPAAAAWHERPWAANMASQLSSYPYLAPWNLADVPALTLPLWHDGGRPLSVQLVAAQGREALLLSVAAQIQTLVPWSRHAPGWGVPTG